MKELVQLEISKFNLQFDRWFDHIYKSTCEIIRSVRPSSMFLGDTLDLTDYVKIVNTYAPSFRIEFINGVVTK
jgi:hypothetical protein